MRPDALWKAVRFPSDLSTAAGRARDRHRRVALSAAASAFAKIITIATSLISVPLTLHYLGPELYGMWMVISSFTVMLAFADMGLGNGILNEVARAHGSNDRDAIRQVVSSGYVILTAISLLVIAGFGCAYHYVPWYKLFNASSPEARSQAGPALAVFVICFALLIPGSVVQKVQIGLQQSFMNSIWQALSSVASMIAVVAVILSHGSLPVLVLALLGTPVLAAIINTAVFFTFKGRDIRPKFHLVSRGAMRNSMHFGMMFFFLQVIGSVAYGADTMIVAQVAGATAVAQYAIPERLFAMISMIVSMALAPLWPAYGAAIASGDDDWVRKTFRRSLLLAICASGLLSIILIFAAKPLIHLWVGDSVRPSLLLLVGLGVWRTIEAAANAVAFYMTGASQIRFQVQVGSILALAKVGLKISLVYWWGVSGIPWGSSLAFILIGLPPYYFWLRGRMCEGVRGS